MPKRQGCQLNAQVTHKIGSVHKRQTGAVCSAKKTGKNMSVWSILGMLLDSRKLDYVAGHVGVV